MILLVVDDSAHEPTPRAVLRHLEEAGAHVCMVDSDSLRQGQVHISFSWSNEAGQTGGITAHGRQIAWTDISAVWLWRPWFGLIRPDHAESKMKPEARQFYLSQWQRLHRGLSLFLSQTGVFCVNSVPQGAACEEKVWQFELARRLGLTVPATLLTTDLAQVRSFYEANGGDIIYKPLVMPMVERPASEGGRQRFATIYTNRVRPEQLEQTDDFQPSPCLFQGYVQKRTEVRVTIIGKHLFAAEINSQASARASLDWRRYDYSATTYQPYQLPADVEQKLLALTQQLGLVYGAVDLIVTPEGDHVFLELNPNGQFYWIEHMTKLPLTANLARMLMAGRTDYERVEGYANVAPLA